MNRFCQSIKSTYPSCREMHISRPANCLNFFTARNGSRCPNAQHCKFRANSFWNSFSDRTVVSYMYLCQLRPWASIFGVDKCCGSVSARPFQRIVDVCLSCLFDWWTRRVVAINLVTAKLCSFDSGSKHFLKKNDSGDQRAYTGVSRHHRFFLYPALHRVHRARTKTQTS